ncbi:MAG TPA: selenocysteine-specific translation elongation factor [Acidimicrobiia bacterium]|nr:selenocysteine-specific translation elongation factor [Acidimicrobiia bacterium]
MPLIGTAGHVDHGKSTLVERITGRDPDRWREEKQRGLTIDLGFAWTTLPGGTEVSFVDVPGHERFLKNMLAGVEAIDVALFVVSAEESWMPQSEEHLAVLDLLEVDRGVVALTKIDTVDTDIVDLARMEVEERLEGTSLSEARIVPVSAVTGEGLDDLLTALERLLPEQSAVNGRPRLWVDRSFSIPGAGTVVTGSLLDARLDVDDDVEIYPIGLYARVRGLESHEKPHDFVDPGRRVAVNLGGIEQRTVARGQMLGMPAQWDLIERFSATLRPARFVEDLTPRGDYQIHVGSAAVGVDIIGLEGGHAVLHLASSLPLSVGDRFILRDTGRHLVVGGGRVLDPSPGRTSRALAAAPGIDPNAPPDTVAETLLATRKMERIVCLAAHTGGGMPRDAVIVGDLAVHPDHLDDLSQRAETMVEKEHARHPLRSGLPLATLAARLRVDAELAERVVEKADRLERRGPDVALRDHEERLSDAEETAWQRAVDRLEKGLAVPSDSDLGLDPELLHLKIRNGELIRVSPELVYLPTQIDELKNVMAGLGDEFTVADFRDSAGLSRKYAVPILEWSDKEGLTVRRGDLRRLR